MQVSFDSLVIYFREKTSTILLIAAALVQELDISVPDLDWPWKPTIETFYSDMISCRRVKDSFLLLTTAGPDNHLKRALSCLDTEFNKLH